MMNSPQIDVSSTTPGTLHSSMSLLKPPLQQKRDFGQARFTAQRAMPGEAVTQKTERR
jgi:hypothetical protein